MPGPSNLTALDPLLSRLLRECLERGNSSVPAPSRANGSLEIVYVLLMVGLFGFFTVGVMVTNLRSRGSPEPLDPPGAPGSWGRKGRRHLRDGGLRNAKLCPVLENRLAVERPPGHIPQEKSP